MRPSKVEELDTELFENIGYVQADNFLNKPGLLKSWADFVQQLNRSGFSAEPDSYNKSRINLVRPFSPAEKEKALKDAQKKWDRMEEIYDACCANGSLPETKWDMHDVKRWASKEGVSVPWTDEDEAHRYG